MSEVSGMDGDPRIKMAMQKTVEEFRTWSGDMRNRVGWEVEGKDIFVSAERGAALEEAQALPQTSVAQAPWIDQWREQWNVHAPLRAARIQAHGRAVVHEQSHGYGR